MPSARSHFAGTQRGARGGRVGSSRCFRAPHDVTDDGPRRDRARRSAPRTWRQVRVRRRRHRGAQPRRRLLGPTPVPADRSLPTAVRHMVKVRVPLTSHLRTRLRLARPRVPDAARAKVVSAPGDLETPACERRAGTNPRALRTVVRASSRPGAERNIDTRAVSGRLRARGEHARGRTQRLKAGESASNITDDAADIPGIAPRAQQDGHVVSRDDGERTRIARSPCCALSKKRLKRRGENARARWSRARRRPARTRRTESVARARTPRRAGISRARR